MKSGWGSSISKLESRNLKTLRSIVLKMSLVWSSVAPVVTAVIRDGRGKRSSAVIVPRTFRVPGVGIPAPLVYSHGYEEAGYEHRVEFDMNRNLRRGGHRNTAPPAMWRKKERGKEAGGMEERGKEEKEEKKNEMENEKNGNVTMVDGREVRKGQPPPMVALHGFNYPVGQPKSILKRRETTSPLQHQSSCTPFTFDKLSVATTEVPFVKKPRQPMARRIGSFSVYHD